MRYPKLTQINLTKNYKYAFLKDVNFEEPVFDTKQNSVKVKKKVRYLNDPDSDQETFSSKKINTVRPGAIRAAQLIENRPER